MHVDLNQAKTEVAALIQTALSGEEVIITQNNEPVLKLVRISATKPRRQSGSAKGLIWMSDDFDEPLNDFAEYMQ
jgi:antitoxin (DNA-binding transcriptional repressor) of toxin-antitoxin stability system